jgi:hypothetical protein
MLVTNNFWVPSERSQQVSNIWSKLLSSLLYKTTSGFNRIKLKHRHSNRLAGLDWIVELEGELIESARVGTRSTVKTKRFLRRALTLQDRCEYDQQAPAGSLLESKVVQEVNRSG